MIASPGPARPWSPPPRNSTLLRQGKVNTRASSPSRASSAVRLTVLGVVRRSMIETFGRARTRSRV
jgi:hypothetical protein